MYFSVAIRIGIVLTFISIIANVVLCFVSNEYKWATQIASISKQCRWIGLVYIFLAWFMGDGSMLSSGRDTFGQVAHWMSIFSVGWIIVFVVSLLSKLWTDGDKMSGSALATALIYFIVAFFIH